LLRALCHAHTWNARFRPEHSGVSIAAMMAAVNASNETFELDE
jgi:hypothetical protein